MSKKIEKLLSQADAYDVYPTVKLRPLLSPPRSPTDLAEPTLWAFYCPNDRRVCVIEDDLTKFPTVIRCNGRPVVAELGRAIFVGCHLFKPEKRDRLLVVLQSMFGDDKMMGNSRSWIATAGIRSNWETGRSTPSKHSAALVYSAKRRRREKRNQSWSDNRLTDNM